MIKKEDVLKVANLSKIELNNDQVEKFAKELGEILGAFDRLSSIDTAGVEPLYKPLDLNNVLRNDEVKRYSDGESLLKSSGYYADDVLSVPKVVG